MRILARWFGRFQRPRLRFHGSVLARFDTSRLMFRLPEEIRLARRSGISADPLPRTWYYFFYLAACGALPYPRAKFQPVPFIPGAPLAPTPAYGGTLITRPRVPFRPSLLNCVCVGVYRRLFRGGLFCFCAAGVFRRESRVGDPTDRGRGAGEAHDWYPMSAPGSWSTCLDQDSRGVALKFGEVGSSTEGSLTL